MPFHVYYLLTSKEHVIYCLWPLTINAPFFFLWLIWVLLQAIETGFGYGQWLHGEAVAAGMVIDPSSLPNLLPCSFVGKRHQKKDMGGERGRIEVLNWTIFLMNQLYVKGYPVVNFQVMAVDMSYRLGWIDDSLVKRVDKILKQAKLPTTPPETMTVEMFKSIMAVRETNLQIVLHLHSSVLKLFPAYFRVAG